MFCTECGTQIDEGKKFCRNCGSRVGGGVEPAAAKPTEDSQPRAQAIPAETTAGSGANNRLLVVAAGIAVLVLGGAGVYFGTDLFRPAAPRTPPSVSEPLAKGTETPPLPSFEETKDAAGASQNSSSSSNPLESPGSSNPVERPKLPLETLPERSTRPDAPPASNRPAPATPASRGGATPGIYEAMRTTTVYENPSTSSKVLANIPAGTRVTVVGSNGEWLEVHSRRGNPPGFIRRGDATFVEKSN